jgi:hypothetical protein
MRIFNMPGTQLGGPLNSEDALAQHTDSKVTLLLRDQEWRTKAQNIFTSTQQQQSFVERKVYDCISQVPGAFFGASIPHDFDTDHETSPANVSDDGILVGPWRDAPQ